MHAHRKVVHFLRSSLNLQEDPLKSWYMRIRMTLKMPFLFHFQFAFVRETNMYCAFLNTQAAKNWHVITQSEFKTLLGFVVNISCVKFPSTADYCSSSAFYKTLFIRIYGMAQDIWEFIRCSLHFSSEPNSSTSNLSRGGNTA